MDADTIGQVVAIQYKRRAYDHYVILDGRGRAIHVNKKKGEITRDPLDRVLRGASKVTYLKDGFDTRLRNYRHAEALIGSKHTYQFITNNCESWMHRVRTGTAYSKQVDDAVNTTAATILAVRGLLALGGV